MYQTPADIRDDKLQDDYLLGKRMPEQKIETAIDKLQQAPGATFVAPDKPQTSINDLKARLREDPLMLIKQREADHIRSMSATQAHLHRLREQDIDDDHRRRQHRDEKKESSKDKHKHKRKDKHRKSRDDKDQSDSDQEKRRHKKRKRDHDGENTETSQIDDSSKRPKLEEAQDTSKNTNSSDSQHERDPDRPKAPPSPLREHHSHRDRYDPQVPQDGRRAHEHDNGRRGESYGSRYATGSYRGEGREDNYRRNNDDYRSRSYDGRRDDRRYETDRRRYDDHDEYGRTRREEPRDYARPPADAYDRRDSYHAPRESYASSSRRDDGYRDNRRPRERLPELSDAERQQMLDQMQRNAKMLQQARSNLIDDSRAEDAREQESHRQVAQKAQESGQEMPSFVTKMNEDAIKSTSVEERVARSRYYLDSQ